MNVLTIYYFRKGENYYDKAIWFLKQENTEIAAEYVRQAVGGVLFEIDTVKPYATDFKGCCREAKAELDADARPEIKAFLPDVSSFDAIFVCYPNWCDTVSMCILSFWDHYDLSGKRLIPLCTNESSGLGRSVRHLRRLYPSAEIAEGYALMGCQTAAQKAEISAWAKQAVLASSVDRNGKAVKAKT